MTLKTAIARLIVAAIALLTAILRLLGAIAGLVTVSVVRLTSALRQRASCPQAASAPAAPERAPSAPQAPSEQARRLTAALTGMGFRRHDVTRFVACLGARVEHERVESLIKDGLRALASN